ncbi:hypothetical protein LWC05_11595 [Acetobacter sicerae]|uniref:Glycosyl transferase n=1 Tax=Acetobacter sicerae TaxID=85325 RepID=A0ABS8VU56_9PROT|nr:hypothetical protein [Acetobacter sicerae]MCE0744527.1 hypothetical protein [Acetobacter sicerae]
MSEKLCSLVDLAREIPNLPLSGPARLAALRAAVGNRPAPAALGVRRRAIRKTPRTPSFPITSSPRPAPAPRPPVIRMTEAEAKALPVEVRFFDREWYLKQHPDVGHACIDPSRHYMEKGWREGRNPNPYFDGRAYLEANPDVDPATNPFEHFIFFGIAERRRLKAAVK